MEDEQLSRHQLLAAEIFGYSYANYRDHLGIGNVRYDELMPRDAERLEAALREDWPIGRVATELSVDTDNAASLLDATRRGLRLAATASLHNKRLLKATSRNAHYQHFNFPQKHKPLKPLIFNIFQITGSQDTLPRPRKRIYNYSIFFPFIKKGPKTTKTTKTPWSPRKVMMYPRNSTFSRFSAFAKTLWTI